MATAALQAWRVHNLLSEASAGPAPGHNLPTLSNALVGTCGSTASCCSTTPELDCYHAPHMEQFFTIQPCAASTVQQPRTKFCLTASAPRYATCACGYASSKPGMTWVVASLSAKLPVQFFKSKVAAFRRKLAFNQAGVSFRDLQNVFIPPQAEQFNFVIVVCLSLVSTEPTFCLM